MKVAERMMLEGDIREEFAEWMEEMKGTFMKYFTVVKKLSKKLIIYVDNQG